MRAIEPCKIKLADGVEREFLLTLAGMKTLRERFKCNMGELLSKYDISETLGPILTVSQVGREKLTEAQIEAIVPMWMVDLSELVQELFKVSLPEPKPENPTTPTPIQ